MIEALRAAVVRAFNADFYLAAVTAIPIFFITLAVEVRAANLPIMRRMIALYQYRKLRRFESLRERLHWLFRGLLLLLAALLPAVTVLGWAAELVGLVALDRRAIGQSAHLVVLVGVLLLPTIVLLWAIAIREREPTPIDEELDRLAEERREAIVRLHRRLRSMEASADGAARGADARRTRRRLAALTRQNRRLNKSTGTARRALGALRDRERARRDSLRV